MTLRENADASTRTPANASLQDFAESSSHYSHHFKKSSNLSFGLAQGQDFQVFSAGAEIVSKGVLLTPMPLMGESKEGRVFLCTWNLIIWKNCLINSFNSWTGCIFQD